MDNGEPADPVERKDKHEDDQSPFPIKAEMQLHQEVERLYMSMVQHVSLLGSWTEYILIRLGELAEKPVERSTSLALSDHVTDAESLTMLAYYREQLESLIKQEKKLWHQTVTDPYLYPYQEPKCRLSPLEYRLNGLGIIEVTIESNFRSKVESAERGDALIELMGKLVQTKQDIARLASMVPFEGRCLLGEIAIFLKGNLDNYKRDRDLFDNWQRSVANAQTIEKEASEIEEQHRTRLQSYYSGARVFPYDLSNIHQEIRTCLSRINAVREKVIVETNKNMLSSISQFNALALNVGLTFDEMIAIATAELVRSMESFQWRRGTRFFSYAYRRVRAAVKEELNRLNPTVDTKIRPREIKIVADAFETWKATHPTGKPSLEEMCALTGYTERKLQRMWAAYQESLAKDGHFVQERISLVPLNAPIDQEQGDQTHAEVVEDTTASIAAEDYDRQVVLTALNEAIKKLPIKERKVMKLYSGTNPSNQVFTLEQISEKLRINHTTVGELRDRARCRLSQILQEDPRIRELGPQRITELFGW